MKQVQLETPGEDDDDRHERGEGFPTSGRTVELEQGNDAGPTPPRGNNDSQEYVLSQLKSAFKLIQVQELNPNRVVEWLDERLHAKARTSTRRLGETLDSALERMDARAEKRELPIPTPWPDFNDQLPGGGFWPGCHILAGGTGAGKSAWALQLGHHAAERGVPVAYAALELEDMQIALRIAAERAGVGWSQLYTGQADARQRALAHEAKSALERLPIYIDNGGPNGWSATHMQALARRVRRNHPTGPFLIVVDFLQLIAAEDDAPRMDLRERIGRAAYTARSVARDAEAAVLLISSVGRMNYESVSGLAALAKAGLDADKRGSIVVERYMRNPEALVGLGKESGEIEYAADSVTAAIAMSRVGSSKERQMVFATAKLRAGRPSWCSLNFNGWRFSDDPTHGRDLIESLEKQGDRRPKSNGHNQKNTSEEYDA